jgi:hypothetical protein
LKRSISGNIETPPGGKMKTSYHQEGGCGDDGSTEIDQPVAQ